MRYAALYRVLQKARMVQLSSVAETTSGTTPSRERKDYWEPARYPWVKTGEIAFRPIRKTEESVSAKAISECSMSLLPSGTVLIAMYGQGKTRGQSAILEIEATTNQACFAILPNNELDPEYLQFWFRHSYQAFRNLSEARGGNQSNLNASILNSYKIPMVDLRFQSQIAGALKAQLAEVEKARKALEAQLAETTKLSDSIIMDSINRTANEKYPLGDVLDELKAGIGKNWASYPVLGATRAGLAPAKEPPGKNPQKYKPVFPGTVFYNPMRILIGSIAFVDDDDAPGITSPDYVALKGKERILDSRWFYFWLRSPLGEQCIHSLARGAVRERMLFNRLAEGEITLPEYDIQQTASRALSELKPMRRAVEQKLNEINLIPAKILSQAFEMN